MYKITVPYTKKAEWTAKQLTQTLKPVYTTITPDSVIVETPSEPTWRLICFFLEEIEPCVV